VTYDANTEARLRENWSATASDIEAALSEVARLKAALESAERQHIAPMEGDSLSRRRFEAAKAAMQAWLLGEHTAGNPGDVAEQAVEYADALLAALAAPRTAIEALAELENATRELVAVDHAESMARSARTTALNRVNELQKKVNVALAKLRELAPHGTDWARSLRDIEATARAMP
jgi:hypothetical protein